MGESGRWRTNGVPIAGQDPYLLLTMTLRLLTALCVLIFPVHGNITAGFAPGIDGYSGHWGVDIDAPHGTAVLAPTDGEVTFAGSVAGMQTVTVRFGADMRVSVSFLSAVSVDRGDVVVSGDRIGTSGSAHGTASVHVSVRRGSRYVDPGPLLTCSRGVIRLLQPR